MYYQIRNNKFQHIVFVICFHASLAACIHSWKCCAVHRYQLDSMYNIGQLYNGACACGGRENALNLVQPNTRVLIGQRDCTKIVYVDKRDRVKVVREVFLCLWCEYRLYMGDI